MSETEQNFWRKCSSCKNPIGFGIKYYICSVSTCNGQRTGYVFCNMACFERHLPGARHKDAAAIEMVSPRNAPSVGTPATATAAAQPAASKPSTQPTRPLEHRPPNRTIIRQPGQAQLQGTQLSREVLVIASRLKDYIQARSEYNTSASVMDVISDHVRDICDRGIDNASADGRKTVMDRDFQFLKNLK